MVLLLLSLACKLYAICLVVTHMLQMCTIASRVCGNPRYSDQLESIYSIDGRVREHINAFSVCSAAKFQVKVICDIRRSIYVFIRICFADV